MPPTLDVVLQRRSGNQQLERSREPTQRLVQLTLGVLQAMGFIHQQRLPLDRAQVLSILQHELVRRQEDVEFEFLWVRTKLELANDFTRLARADVGDDVEIGRPGLELGLPGGEGGQGDDDQEGAVLVDGVDEVGKECDGLNANRSR